MFHFTVVLRFTKLIVVDSKSTSSFGSEHSASQKMLREHRGPGPLSHEGLPCVYFLSLFVNPAKPKLLQGFILPFHGRNNSCEGNYILHITVKKHVCFIFAREEKTTRQFSLYNCHSPEQPLKMWLIFLSEISVISSTFLCNIFLPAVCIFFFFFFRKQFQYEFFMVVLQSSELYQTCKAGEISTLVAGAGRTFCQPHKGNSIP